MPGNTFATAFVTPFAPFWDRSCDNPTALALKILTPVRGSRHKVTKISQFFDIRTAFLVNLPSLF